jgi:hypothetical protein
MHPKNKSNFASHKINDSFPFWHTTFCVALTLCILHLVNQKEQGCSILGLGSHVVCTVSSIQ